VTTHKQIKELAAPLLARNPDLALVKSMIVVRPVAHFLRFIFIERTGNADTCEPRWGTTYLFRNIPHMPIGDTRLLYRPGPRKLWSWSDSTMIQSFVDTVECEVLPQLRAVCTAQDYFDKVLLHSPDHPSSRWAPMMAYSLALGDLDQAQALLKQNPRIYDSDVGSLYVQALNKVDSGLGTRLLDLGGRLGRDDRLKIAEYLHEKEARSTNHLGLEKLWARTLFPIEEANAGASSGAV
jgi:hypothetical protein